MLLPRARDTQMRDATARKHDGRHYISLLHWCKTAVTCRIIITCASRHALQRTRHQLLYHKHLAASATAHEASCLIKRYQASRLI